MAGRDYWLERETQNAEKSERYTDRQIALITRWFNRAKKEMSQKILTFYRKYADAEGITLPEAKKRLNDTSLLQTTLEDYAALAEQAPENAGIKAYLDKLSMKRSISRLEFLQLQLDLILDQTYLEYDRITTETLTNTFEQGYYKTLFDYQQYVGFGSGFNRLSVNQIMAAVTTNWSGKDHDIVRPDGTVIPRSFQNYSERIWGNQRQTLARKLNRVLTTGMIAGRSNKEMRQQLEKEVDASTYNIRRLVRTESTYVTGQAAMRSYKQNGTEKYRFYAVLDLRTSEICRELDGKVFNLEDAQVGTNYPPMHPHCRSRTAPEVSDSELDALSGVGTREARGPDGDTYKVPADMAYNEWYEQYVKNQPGMELHEKKLKNIYGDQVQYEKYKALLGKDAPESLDAMQTLKYTDSDRWNDIKAFARYKRKWPEATSKDFSIQKDLSALGVKGKVEPPQIPKDLSQFTFDDAHINSQRGHNISRAQAESFIRNSQVSIKRWNGRYSNYYSTKGAAFVDMESKSIRTAFSQEEFDDTAAKIKEVLKKYE